MINVCKNKNKKKKNMIFLAVGIFRKVIKNFWKPIPNFIDKWVISLINFILFITLTNYGKLNTAKCKIFFTKLCFTGVSINFLNYVNSARPRAAHSFRAFMVETYLFVEVADEEYRGRLRAARNSNSEGTPAEGETAQTGEAACSCNPVVRTSKRRRKSMHRGERGSQDTRGACKDICFIESKHWRLLFMFVIELDDRLFLLLPGSHNSLRGCLNSSLEKTLFMINPSIRQCTTVQFRSELFRKRELSTIIGLWFGN